ncbi:phosphate:H symporter [Planoprotostelium fungivorum]|uniref:Phosphate:H symporter n=1 Tax=Planoprotostelium fungivorum TaxID=1890364 RepID=A0A2P6N2A0_9EUKA|nr:phosphate:H symporter [Planoprotostelium fungivorum]
MKKLETSEFAPFDSDRRKIRQKRLFDIVTLLLGSSFKAISRVALFDPHLLMARNLEWSSDVWKNGKVLLGTASAWFLLDVAYSGITLNQSYIIDQIGFTQNGDAYTLFTSIAKGNTVAVCMGLLPGYCVAIALINVIGSPCRSLVSRVSPSALAIFYDLLKAHAPKVFVAIYAVPLFCFNCGPNTTTFIIPGEVFPTRFCSANRTA